MKICFDMDGVLAKFLFGTPYPEIFKEHYFENLPPQNNFVDAAKMLSSNHDVCILSAYLPDSEYARKEKQIWLKKWLPEIPESNWILVPYGASKGDYISAADDILIDDRWLHGNEWINAGGKFFKVSVNKSDAEKEKKKYKYVLYPDMKAEDIAKEIERRI